MPLREAYQRQVALLLRVLPHVAGTLEPEGRARTGIVHCAVAQKPAFDTLCRGW